MTRARDLASGQNGVRPFATAAGTWGGTSGTYASTWQIAWYVGQVSVTFPAGRFTQAPMVTASGEGQTSGGVWSVPQIAWVWTVSSTGFVSLVGNPYGNYGVTYRWVATQMTSSSAVG